ncbi:MAG TPA: NADH-quinone oxidoreductase subunit L, partial [Chthoniobacteraceae bacterium]|nr:NADH-quinone oxidoreductase subunit L [Chthoniobacteraceae bacterium]
ILVAAYQKSFGVFLVAVFTAFLTAFYMTRLFVVVFFGKGRSHAAEHGHDGPGRMTLPLIILAVLSVIAGYGIISTPALGHAYHEALEKLHHGPGSNLAIILGILAFLVGTAAGYVLYVGKDKDPILIPPFKQKFYFDELYAALIAGTQDLLAKLGAFADKWIIDGVLVRVSSGAVWGLGFMLRFFQFGNLQGYAFLFAAGVVALIYFMVFA